MAYALIWSKTAYKTQKCFKCGHRVRYPNGDPCDDTLFDPKAKKLYCPSCMQLVAKIKDDQRSFDDLLDTKDQNGGKWDGDLDD